MCFLMSNANIMIISPFEKLDRFEPNANTLQIYTFM